MKAFSENLLEAFFTVIAMNLAWSGGILATKGHLLPGFMCMAAGLVFIAGATQHRAWKRGLADGCKISREAAQAAFEQLVAQENEKRKQAHDSDDWWKEEQ